MSYKEKSMLYLNSLPLFLSLCKYKDNEIEKTLSAKELMLLSCGAEDS